MHTNPHPDEHERAGRAAALKERIYLTFASLAVVIALTTHGHAEAGPAARTLAVTVFGLLLSMFVADVVSHIVVHETFPTRAEFGHMVRTTFGAVGAVTVPFVLLAIAHFTDWDAVSALKWSAGWLLVSLVGIGFLAVRKLELTFLQKLIVLGAEAGLGFIVISLQILAHGG
ncbi:MAG: hypothetical protein KC435_05370 [Thermomicrobiales bacterium]|nr:hypothetical protein [Thermomicrobiales bacterium]